MLPLVCTAVAVATVVPAGLHFTHPPQAAPGALRRVHRQAVAGPEEAANGRQPQGASAENDTTGRTGSDEAGALRSWPEKASYAEFTRVRWAGARPLPHLLWGKVGRSLRGVVENVSAKGVVVRLLWERAAVKAALPRALRPPPVPSPIVGLLDADALSPALGRPVGSDLQEIRRFIREEQRVNVRVSPHEQTGEMLALELDLRQPIEPPREAPAFAQRKPLASITNFLQEHQQRVGGLLNVTETLQVPAPPSGWGDKDWAPWLRFMPQEPAMLPPLVAAAWALTDAGRDLVVAGPLTHDERALLYALPLLRHLRGQPEPMAGSGPVALILGDRLLRDALQAVLEAQNISVAQARSQQPQPCGCSVLLANPKDYLKMQRTKQGGKLVHLSFLAFDNLGFWAEAPAVRRLVQQLPRHKWGPSLVWLHKWNASLLPALGSVAAAPLSLRGADSAWGAAVLHEAMKASEVKDRVAYYMHQYPRLRVLVFANQPALVMAVLRRADVQRRSANPDAAGAASNRSTAVVASNRKAWPAGGQIYDVVLHADAPPSQEEYHRRLGACRQLAVTLMSLSDRSGELDDKWRSFAQARKESVGPEERLALLELLGDEPRRGRQKTRRLREPPRLKEPSRGEADMPPRRFEDDFGVSEKGELVWSAGEETIEEEFAVFTDMI